MMKLAVKIAAWGAVAACLLNAPLSLWVFGLALSAWVTGVMYGIELTVDRAADDYQRKVEEISRKRGVETG